MTLCIRATANAEPPPDWRHVAFEGETRYRLTDAGCWRARAEASASGLVREQAVNLARTPWLNWRWRAAETPAWPAADERSKQGDDFLARVYVIKEGWVPWRTRAINYVWSRSHPPGSHWPNPYAGQAEMVVVQGPDGAAGPWRGFSRDVAADFKRFHDMEVDSVDAVAIMTDTDNTGAVAEACYELPSFSAQPQHARPSER
ncbi:DUF3047 domain-containing protein [Alloalcanivorax venustensis]|uniref:DUF3047 domain-containing protein n=1 Tax=Alloalcanivorax venustensis TaxID=172371 RepID=UPI00351456F2